MKLQAEVQYTIRGVSSEVDSALRGRSVQQKVSLNQIIVNILTKTAIGREQRADFSDLTGKWVDDPGFDEVISSQRQIDWEKWK